MSLLSATPSISNRTARRDPRADLPRLGASRLQLVHDQAGPHRPGPARANRVARPARPVAPVPVAAVPVAPVPVAPVPVATRTRLRLTRRGRIVMRIVTTLLIAIAVIAGVLLINRSAQAGSQAQSVPASYRVVLPGETLWQIAGEVAPTVDRRDTVARIVELNALPNAHVLAGQRIAVPAGSSR